MFTYVASRSAAQKKVFVTQIYMDMFETKLRFVVSLVLLIGGSIGGIIESAIFYAFFGIAVQMEANFDTW